MPEGVSSFLPRSDILSYEELLYVVHLCVVKGIRKIRLTGGEPLVRNGIIPFIEKLHRISELEEISLTTNGVFLKDVAGQLKKCGIRRINLSMDTLKPERFREITRRDCFDQVWEGVREAESCGVFPIKINVVLMRGVNEDEIIDFVKLTYDNAYHIRFIELMPVGGNNWAKNHFVSIEEVLKRIRAIGPVRPVDSGPLDGPALRYVLEGARGEIGLIGAMSRPFCSSCNRIRLTADGHLKGCLLSNQETDIKTPLRNGREDHCLLGLIEDTILNKPEKHGLDIHHAVEYSRSMNSIGG